MRKDTAAVKLDAPIRAAAPLLWSGWEGWNGTGTGHRPGPVSELGTIPHVAQLWPRP